MPSFSDKKQLRFVITLGTGKFGSSNNDQIILQGFRAIADIDKAGGMMMGTLRAKIYGVKQADMNSVTTLQWKPGSRIANTIEVYAIDGAAETLVFAGNIVNAPSPADADGTLFRAAWTETLLPAIDAFRPQLLLVSAGFDAHRRDPLAQLRLEAEDYAWITRELVRLANRHCGGRIVSSLEGGYDLEALRESVVAHVGELLT